MSSEDDDHRDEYESSDDDADCGHGGLLHPKISNDNDTNLESHGMSFKVGPSNLKCVVT